jgi:hypothetical protein
MGCAPALVERLNPEYGKRLRGVTQGSIPRVDTAIDCGFCVNPERVRSQMEGAAVMGLTLARYGEITVKNGRVEQGNFKDFPIVRIDEAPAETRVHIVEHGIDVPASGVGEPGVPPFAPALCNAIFAATGKRIRKAADRGEDRVSEEIVGRAKAPSDRRFAPSDDRLHAVPAIGQ